MLSLRVRTRIQGVRMSRRLLSATMTVFLALAFLLAWTGHAYSLSVPTQSTIYSKQSVSHGHDHAESSCAHCTDHYHSPLTPDHQHETPQLTSLVQIFSTFEPSVRLGLPSDSLPRPPVFRIERPPRLVLAS